MIGDLNKIYAVRELQLFAAQGNEAAFAEIFHLYKHKLYSYLLPLTGSPEVAEDIIQDTFLKLWNNRNILGDIEDFGAYLFRMTHNLAINSFKRMAKETLVLSELQSRPQSSESQVDNTLIFKEAAEALHQTIRSLPPQQKLVYILSREQGLKHDEIAQYLHLSPTTVRNHIVQALRTIRKKIESHATLVIALIILLTRFNLK